jgi:hypothetical protein
MDVCRTSPLLTRPDCLVNLMAAQILPIAYSGGTAELVNSVHMFFVCLIKPCTPSDSY